MPEQQVCAMLLDADQVEWLEEWAVKAGVTKAEMVRRALRLAMVDWSALTPETLEGLLRMMEFRRGSDASER